MMITQLVEECLGAVQIGRVSLFHEAAVNSRQNIADLGEPPLIAPKPRGGSVAARSSQCRAFCACASAMAFLR